jgi:hypothetical protein
MGKGNKGNKVTKSLYIPMRRHPNWVATHLETESYVGRAMAMLLQRVERATRPVVGLLEARVVIERRLRDGEEVVILLVIDIVFGV